MFMDEGPVVRDVQCKSIIDPTMGMDRVSIHASSGIDYTQTNDFLCWHCAAPFDTPPYPAPTSVDPASQEFHVEGNFCSFGCAKAWILECNRFDSRCRMTLLKQLAQLYYGYSVDSIVPAPPRICLTQFGGNMTIDEFRAVTSHVSVASPPFLPIKQVVHTRDPHNTTWSVYNLKRMAPQTPAPNPGERGLYFDYIQQEKSAAPKEPPSKPKTVLAAFIKK